VKERKRFSHLEKILLWLVLVCILAQCSPKNDEPIVYPEDTPKSEFIIGTWRIISVINVENGNTVEVNFPGFRFEDESTVSYADFYQDVYKFSEPDVIVIDTKRLAENQVWRLEREDNNLIMYSTDKNKTLKYVLKRCSSRQWC
jgi:hypothetical protein